MRLRVSNDRPSATELVAYCVIGVGVGWLAGLSTAPVIAIIITSLVGSISALVAGAAGLQGTPQRTGIFETTRFRVNPAPLALLVTGLLVGSSLGIVARTHNWLGVDLEAQVREWTDLGLEHDDVVQRYFSNASSAFQDDNRTPSHLETVLFNSDRDECDRLLALQPSVLARELRNSSEPSHKWLLNIQALEVDSHALYGALTIACNYDVRLRLQ